MKPTERRRLVSFGGWGLVLKKIESHPPFLGIFKSYRYILIVAISLSLNKINDGFSVRFSYSIATIVVPILIDPTSEEDIDIVAVTYVRETFTVLVYCNVPSIDI